MKKKLQLTEREMDQFEDYLRHDEREESTIEAYLRSLTRFAEWADGRTVTKELAMEWKAALSEAGYRPISVNAMLAAVNKFFTCMGREDCKVKYLKLQRQMFRKSEKDLSKEEYQRLVQAAHEKGDLRMELILETICATGIRVGELKYITVEAVRAGVERSKAFPHNLRSLFARSFYGSCHDVVRLADVLGHSSIETTRIYLMSTGKEYLRQLDKLGLVQ